MSKKYLLFNVILASILFSCGSLKTAHKDTGSLLLNQTNNNNLIEDDGIELITSVEKQPEFPGGIEALIKYLNDNVRYPDEALKDAIEGKVIVRFDVNKDGSISDITIVRSLQPLLDAEAVRVINAMPKWNPGTQRGKPIKVGFTLPVNFSLNYLDRKYNCSPLNHKI